MQKKSKRSTSTAKFVLLAYSYRPSPTPSLVNATLSLSPHSTPRPHQPSRFVKQSKRKSPKPHPIFLLKLSRFPFWGA
ncbi:hypothetical protein CC80DRAFT_94464 [Byssothecium circinans]|uniref:Uncharacterized protein n=1 Tax=Byssothecium circinans TaxID=147558 RepID=A0A6A5TRY8_9PLEO|nr:hypothetical protein CC80DRAFT_94464 [Byssothecium circinans]